MHAVLAAQKASLRGDAESLSVRTDRIDRPIALPVDHAEDFAKAVSDSAIAAANDVDDRYHAVGQRAQTCESTWRAGRRVKTTSRRSHSVCSARKARCLSAQRASSVLPRNFPVGMVFVPMAGSLRATARWWPSEFTENVSTNGAAGATISTRRDGGVPATPSRYPF